MITGSARGGLHTEPLGTSRVAPTLKARLVLSCLVALLVVPVAPSFSVPPRPYCVRAEYLKLPPQDRDSVKMTARFGIDDGMRYAILVLFVRDEIHAHCAIGWEVGGLVLCECGEAVEWRFSK